MQIQRRQVLAAASLAAVGAYAGTAQASTTAASVSEHVFGVLVDLTQCVGCRLCEYACRKSNGIDPGPLKSYDDQSVFRAMRRPGTMTLTVLNEWKGADGKPVYAKVNCLHCNHPACASACIVGAIQKQENGAVTYDAWKCIGCRYCMVACPFQIPAYEYDDAFTPRVRKCEFCFNRTSKGEQPACVQECPRQVMQFGKRAELLKVAHERIAKHPDRYVNHVYGEHEVGGTSWMYLSAVPFEQAGFLSLGTAAPPALTEAIQHGVFKYWIAPVGWYSFLTMMYWWTGRRANRTHVSKSNHAATEVADHSIEVTPAHEAASLGDRSDWAPQIGVPADLRQIGTPAQVSDYRKLWHPQADTSNVAVLEAPPVTPPRPRPAHHDHADQDNHAHHDHAAPVGGKLLTPGVWLLIAIVLIGAGFGLYRFIFGLAASTNLDQQHPWGLWIAMDVGSGIALAGGGFVTAAVVHIFHRERYHAVARSALLTALLGYTFYVPGLLADIGRWYNIWHPTIPTMWQGNSVLFEVGLCVMIYLNVQYAELAPIVISRLLEFKHRFPKFIARTLKPTHDLLEKVMPALLILGVALSTFHQSSLGNLMVIAPYKLHTLWWSPLSPVFFLFSAMMVGFPMVIFTILFASWSLKRKPEIHVLAPLSRYIPVFIWLYLASKVFDIFWRDISHELFKPTLEVISWWVEMLMAIVPMLLLCITEVRNSAKWLGGCCLTIILGVVLNRLNVFIIGYHPPYAEKGYFPSVAEFAVSAALVAALLLVYRIAVTWLPILEPRPKVGDG